MDFHLVLLEVFDPFAIAEFSLVAVVLFVIMLLAAALDLSTGVRRAKQLGVYRSSRGLRRTIEKLVTYGTFYALCLLADCVLALSVTLFQWNIPAVPFICIIETLYVVYIEYRSIVENTKDPKLKTSLKGGEELLRTIISAYGPDAVKEVIESFNNKKESESDNA